MQLEDRFYTSTEVAEILGVSLRSVYRYLEDDKLKAEVKTATGRHRFTKQNIIDFLYPDGKMSPLLDEASEPQQPQQQVQPQFEKRQAPVQQIKEKEPEVEEEQVDWLAKFREAATKYKQEQEVVQPAPQPIQPQPVQPAPQVQYQPVEPIQPQPVQPAPQVQYQPVEPIQPQPVQPAPQAMSAPSLMYYRSMLGGLKDIAQNLDKSARNSNLEYAFTINAGASLHKPIKPFATLHAYVRSGDRDFFEKILRLTPSNQTNAQLCLVVSDSGSIYSGREEVHGLFVVSKDQLKRDIASFGDAQLAQEMADVL